MTFFETLIRLIEQIFGIGVLIYFKGDFMGKMKSVLLVFGCMSFVSCSMFLNKSSDSEAGDSAVLAARIQNLNVVRLKVTGNAQLTGSIKNANVQARTIPTSGTNAGKCDGEAGTLLAKGFTSYGSVDKNDGGTYSLSMEKPADSTICIVITPTPESSAYSPFQKRLIPWRPRVTSNGQTNSVRVTSLLVLSDANSVSVREFKASGNINPLTNMATAKFSSAMRQRTQLQIRSKSGEIQSSVLSPTDIEKLVSNSNEAIGQIFFKGSTVKVDPSKMNFSDPTAPGYDPGLAKQFNAVMGGIDSIIAKLISGKGLNPEESDDISTLYDSYLDLVGGDIAGDGVLDGLGIVDESGNPVTVSTDFTNVMADPAGSLSQGMSTYVTQVAVTGGDDGSGVVWTAADTSNPSFTGSGITSSIPAPTSFSYANSPYIYIVGLPITSLNPTVTGTVTSYTISPALPTGLSLSGVTGVISGIPATAQTATNYIVTASNSSGTTSATIRITVNLPAPTSLTYGGANYVYVVGTPIPNLSASITGTIGSYSVSPTLPAGLSLNTTTGVISGTPTVVQTATNYTITATNSGGSTGTTISITVNHSAPNTLTYGGSNFTYTVGTPISNLTASVAGTITSFSVSPALPSGLSLNTTTGVISGTPTTSQSATNYTVTATNSGGTTSTILSIAINLAVPSSLTYGGTNFTYITGTTITNLTPSVTGTVSSYSITPALPTGLTLNISTGIISGVPTSTQGLTAYTVTATNSAGSTTANINITVNALAISYVGSPFSFANGATISSKAVTNNGFALSYGISPALPTGLILNTSTGLISGTPSVTSGSTAYTITATANSGVTATTSINITVYQPITISYTGSPFTYNVSSTITSLTPTVTNGPSTGYSISPALSAGLSFNTTTGVISGTPSAMQSLTSYTITATSASNGSNTTSILITVNQMLAPTSLSYSGNPFTFLQNTAITTQTPTVTGIVSSCSVSPTLPAGLAINNTNCAITGTPTTLQSASNYTVTATNAGGNTTFVLSIAISDLPAQCFSYTSITGDDRHTGLTGGTKGCDSGMTNSWVRFTGTYNRLASSMPAINYCNTDAPGYLTTSHPATKGQQVAGTTCFNWSSNACNFTYPIQITNCDTFYIYQLPATSCSLKYCSSNI